jgi:hypothetical protein
MTQTAVASMITVPLNQPCFENSLFMCLLLVVPCAVEPTLGGGRPRNCRLADMFQGLTRENGDPPTFQAGRGLDCAP